MEIYEPAEVIVEFPNSGVRVKIPPQKNQQKMFAITVPSVPFSKMSSEKDEFKPARFVINVEIVDANDPMTILTDFDPAFELRVKYTADDMARLELAKAAYKQAGGIEGGKDEPVFQLGFWNGCKWVLFTKEKHHYRIEPNNPPETGGVEVVDISIWGDPAIGQGP